MILSNLSSRGTIKGTIYRGGGGGVTDYNALSGKPQINGTTVEDNHDGGYYGLIDSADIEVTEIYEIGYGSNYNINLNGSSVNVTNQRFHGATNSANGSKGLVPAPAAGSVGKILSNEGWIDPPNSIKNYSTTEQKTGQKWIDGKDIYFKTYVVNNVASNPSDWVLIDTISGVDEFISSNDTFKFTTSNITYGGYYVSTSYRHSTNGLYYYVRELGGGSGDIRTTIYYTKS